MNKLNWKKDLWGIFFVFIIAGLLRALPEIKAGVWPIGYDTFNAYAPDLLKFDGDYLRWIFSANLLYFILWPFYHFLHIDPYLLMKIAGPVLYGSFGVTFYLFCRKFLKWGSGAVFLTSLLLIVQLAALRISWDLFRNLLGLIFLFPSFYLLENNEKTKNPILLMIFSILIILSNQLVASLWFVILLAWLIKTLVKKDYPVFWETLIVILPTIVIWILILKSPGLNSFGGHVFYKGESDRVFNYFVAYKNQLSSYNNLINTIWNLFLLYYKYLAPVAIVGMWFLRKNFLLWILTIWLLFGTFSSFIFKGYGLFVWDRWLLMLVIPLTIYAAAVFFGIGNWIINRKIFAYNNIQIFLKALGVLIFLSFIIFFFAINRPFLTTPNKDAKAPFLNSQLNAYIPPTMLNNAVGYENLDHVLNSIQFLNTKTPENAVILIDNRYRGLILTKLNYDNRYVYTYAWASKPNEEIIQEVRDKNLGPIYTIWTYRSGVKGFDRVFKSGETSVYVDKVTNELFKNKEN